MTRDPAESAHASHWPDPADGIDSLGDQLREALAGFIPRVQQLAAFAVLDRVLEHAEVSEPPARAELSEEMIVIETVRSLFGDTAWKASVASLSGAALVQLGRANLLTLSRGQIAVETCRAIYGDTRHHDDVRRIAKAGLITLSQDAESYQATGDEFGCTRAAVHNNSREYERKTGIKPRRAKSERARAGSVAAASRPRGVPTAAIIKKPKGYRGIFCFLGL